MNNLINGELTELGGPAGGGGGVLCHPAEF